MDSQKEYEYLLQKIADPDTSDSARARAVERLQAVVANMQKEAARGAERAKAEPAPSGKKNIPKNDMDDMMERAMRGENISDDDMNAMQEKMMKQMMSSMGGMGMFMGGGAGMGNEPKQKRPSGRGGMDDMMERAMRGDDVSESEANSMQENLMKQMMSSIEQMGMFMGGAKGGKGLGDIVAAAMRGDDISESELENMQKDMTERMKNPMENTSQMPDLSALVPGFAMPNAGGATSWPSALPDDRRYAVDTGDDEVIEIPIYNKEDEKRVLEWLKNELYAEDYFETVYGPHYDSPIDVINKPVSRFEKYAEARKKR